MISFSLQLCDFCTSFPSYIHTFRSRMEQMMASSMLMMRSMMMHLDLFLELSIKACAPVKASSGLIWLSDRYFKGVYILSHCGVARSAPTSPSSSRALTAVIIITGYHDMSPYGDFFSPYGDFCDCTVTFFAVR